MISAVIPRGRMVGDADADGMFSKADIVAVNKISADLIEYDAETYDAADVDRSGEVDARDVTPLNKLISGEYKAGRYPDVTGAWTQNPDFAADDAQFYYDIPIEGMTADMDAAVMVASGIEFSVFVRGECRTNALRIYVSALPIAALPCIIAWCAGSGVVVTLQGSYNFPVSAKKPKYYIGKLLQANWSGKSKNKYTLTVPEIYQGDSQTRVSVTPLEDSDATLYNDAEVDYSLNNGSISFTATTTPTEDIWLEILITPIENGGEISS